MHLCHELRPSIAEGAVSDALVDEVLDALYIGRTRTNVDAYWHHEVVLDPDEWLRMRAKQKMVLARYGRQSVLQWADVDVGEMQQYYDLLAEIIKDENIPGFEDR